MHMRVQERERDWETDYECPGRYSREPEEGIGSPDTRVIGSCEPFNKGSGMQI